MKALDEAVRSYVLQLAPELQRRWGKQKFYNLEQVTQAAEASGVTTEFIVYAHAIFCNEPEFRAHYRGLRDAFDYEGTRSAIAKRYGGGVADFDVGTLLMMMG